MGRGIGRPPQHLVVRQWHLQQLPRRQLFGAEAVRLLCAAEPAQREQLMRRRLLGRRQRLPAKLKGSVGEGPNQTNYSDRSSVRILAKFSLEN